MRVFPISKLVLLVLFALFALSSSFAEECTQRPDCSECIKSLECVWCEDAKLCIPGDPTGPKDKELCPTGEWRWKQCAVDGQIIVWVVVGVVGAVILILTFGIWFCCYKRGKKREARLLEDYERSFEERNTKQKEHTESKWQQKRDEMRAKYGRVEDEN